MRIGPVNTCIAGLCFIIYSSALPSRTNDYRKLSSEFVPKEGGASGNNLRNEPSCDELRAMWRFSKRQSRTPEMSNELPTYNDPFAFNNWENYTPRTRSGSRVSRFREDSPVYGKLVHSKIRFNNGERMKAFEEVAKLFGSTIHQQQNDNPRRKTGFKVGGSRSSNYHSVPVNPINLGGGFQHLKDLIKNERARELRQQALEEDKTASDQLLEDYARMTMNRNIDPYAYQERPQPVVRFPDILVPSEDYEDYLLPTAPQYANIPKINQRLKNGMYRGLY